MFFLYLEASQFLIVTLALLEEKLSAKTEFGDIRAIWPNMKGHHMTSKPLL